MKISLNWLQDFIELTEKDPEKIKAILTANSAEVETIEKVGGDLANVVVGKIEEIKDHPNADSLKICMVNDGQKVHPVVCGGSNVKEGIKIAFAQIGAVVSWHGSETMTIKEIKIRGEESFGMICASDEIGLSELFPKEFEKEIMDISHIDAKVGTPLAKALNLDDTVIDIDNHAITNRPDLFSQAGFAREFVANGMGKWKKQTEWKMPENKNPTPIEIDIKYKEGCSNYLGVYITNVEVAESPDWMKQRLSACGIRPISNIVDITNYVMLELGMPTHAFDVEQIKGKKWTMRASKKGEKVVTLDQEEEELMENVIVFDDGNELFDLCGIMGGYQSGIKPETTKVWLHSPVYNPTLIRRAARGLGHISDASTIYEKGVDNKLAKKGLERCAELILQLCPNAKIASKITELKNFKEEARTLILRAAQIKRLVGIEIPSKRVEDILEDLGFETSANKEGWKVTVPSWRLKDINREADIIEEIARVNGYDQIPLIAPSGELKPTAIQPKREYERQLKNQLVELGFDEIYTFAFLGPELLSKCEMKANENTIEIQNPISSEMSLMRQSLLPRTLETIEANLRYHNEFSVFELSKVYTSKPEENAALILANAGGSFRELQGVVEHLGWKLKPGKGNAQHHPGRTAEIILRGQTIGMLYEVHPKILKNFDIKARVTVAEIDIEAIHNMNISHHPKYQALPKFPSVKLDISIAIPKKELAENYAKAIQKTDKNLITQVELIDEYTGEKIETEKRALTYSITYRASDRTLTEEEVNTVHKKVIENLQKTGAKVR